MFRRKRKKKNLRATLRCSLFVTQPQALANSFLLTNCRKLVSSNRSKWRTTMAEWFSKLCFSVILRILSSRRKLTAILAILMQDRTPTSMLTSMEMVKFALSAVLFPSISALFGISHNTKTLLVTHLNLKFTPKAPILILANQLRLILPRLCL